LETLENPRAYFLSILTLEYGIFSNRVLLEWLESAAERARSGEYKLRDFQPE
jgi:hypothetical protein